MAGVELHIKKSKGFGKLRGKKGGEEDYTTAKHKTVRVKLPSADPKMMKAMADMICAATK